MKKSKQDRATYMRDYRKTKKESDNESTKLLRELEASYKLHRERIETAMSEAKPGTQIFLKHLEALAKLDVQRRDELVKRGFHAENLSLGVEPAFVFKAYVASDGAVSVSRVRPGQPELPTRKTARNNEDPEKRAQVIAQLEAEFGDAPITRREREE